MQRPSSGRLALVVGLLAILAVLCAWYATFGVAADLGAYPTEQVVGPTPEQYLGDTVSVEGIVVDTEPVTIRLSYNDQSRPLVIRDVDTPVDRGDQLRVFGTLEDENTIVATNTFSVPPSGFLYTYLVSFVAGLWVLGRLVTHWRFADGTLVRREQPLTLTEVRTRLRGATSDA